MLAIGESDLQLDYNCKYNDCSTGKTLMQPETKSNFNMYHAMFILKWIDHLKLMLLFGMSAWQSLICT